MVFEQAQQLYELIFCACSMREEEAWTGAIAQQAEKATTKQDRAMPIVRPDYEFISLPVRSLGPIFGLPESLTRQLSVQRAATVHTRNNRAQVIIRNTTAGKAAKSGSESNIDSLGRSKSAMTASHVPILAPKRAERSRMESALADVWSRDRLPFPGLSTQRDNAIRASATSMMRRISRASIGSTFSRRSTSTTSFVSLVRSVDLPQIGEGPSDRDPRMAGYESLVSTPRQDHVTEEKIEGSGNLVRTGTVTARKLWDATNQVRERQVPRFSGQSVRIESTDKGSPRMVKHRKSIPGTLFKGFSPERSKGWRS